MKKADMRLVSTDWGKFWVYPQDCIGATIAANRLWDAPFLVPFFEKVLAQKGAAERVVVDIGAYMGYLTVWLSRRFKSVYAVECMPKTIDVLRQNVGLNECTNVAIVPIAAYDGERGLRLPNEYWGDYVNLDNIGGLGLTRALWSAADIRGQALDDRLFGIDVVAIKVDAQGCDLPALRGMRGVLRRCRPAVVFEWEPEMALLHGWGWVDVLAFFNDLNYMVEPVASAAHAKNNFEAFPR